MSRYVKRPRPEPTDEILLAAILVFGPFALLALLVRWAGRWMRAGR